MKKKISIFLLVVFTIVSCFGTLSVSAQELSDHETENDDIKLFGFDPVQIIDFGTFGTNLTWVLDDHGTLTIDGTNEIPDFNDSDLSPWYEYSQDIISVVIKNGVTSIGDNAFEDCFNMSEISIPSSVKLIGVSAFLNCSSLTEITIPSSVTSIGDSAFRYCSSLTEITIPSSVTSIGDGTFGGCSSLTEITISSNVTSIGAEAFSDCYDLADITIPSKVTSIGDYAFSDCYSLTDIIIPSNVKSLGSYAFFNCDNLKNITLPQGLTHIGGYCFSEDNELERITIPKGITSIDLGTFSHCNKLSSVVLPDGLENIFPDAFCWCPGLTTLTIPSSVTLIAGGAFNHSGLTSITIPSSLETIIYQTFYYCESLAEVHVPSAVSSIEESAFEGCSSLKDIYYDGTEEKWDDIFNSAGNEYVVSATKHFNNTGTYTVAYNANGGTGAPAEQKKNKDVSLTLSSKMPSRQYEIIFDTNGGSVSDLSKKVAGVFKNWNTKKDGSGKTYASGASYTANENAILFAQWEGNKAGDLPVPERDGYRFLGWYTAKTGGKLLDNSTIISGDITLYALWDPIKSYDLGEETYSFKNYKDKEDGPVGHCYGITMTSAGYYLGLLDIGIIGGDENTLLYSLSDTLTVRKPICHYQPIQGSYMCGSFVAGGSWWNSDNKTHDIDSDWEEVVNYVKDHSYDNKGFLHVQLYHVKSILSPDPVDFSGGHSVNFLYYQNVDGQDRIYIYDSNYPDDKCYLYKNEKGEVREAPKQTFYGLYSNAGIIDSIAIGDVRKYFELAGYYNPARAVYSKENAISIDGCTYSYMSGDDYDGAYVMWEIPEDIKQVKITPLEDNASFTYMDNKYSFGEKNEDTYGILVLASEDDNSVTEPVKESFEIIDMPADSNLFPDVTSASVNKTSYNAIYWAVENGIVKGYGDGTFRPEIICTREQFSIMLWRFAGQPDANASAVNKFTDAGNFSNGAKKAVAWAVEEGIVAGFEDGSFKPKDDITRAQVAVMLWRYAGKPGVSGSSKFSDIGSFGSGVQNAIIWLEGNRIASGYKDGTFKPNDGCQRQHMAIFLYRYNNNIGK